jgi:hypothetical protein
MHATALIQIIIKLALLYLFLYMKEAHNTIGIS